MKRFLAAIGGALLFFWLVVLAGAIGLGVYESAERSLYFSPAELFAHGAFLGSLVFALYGGLPAAVIGAVAGPPAISVLSRRRNIQPPLEQCRDVLDLFADSVFFLVMAGMAAAIACATYFVPFFILFRHAGE